jgi:hypothetical protein
MTHAETEAELGSLRARLLQLEQEQDRRKREWGKLGRISLGVTLGFAALGLGFVLLDSWFHYVGVSPMPTQAAFPVLLVMAPLAILTQALWVVRLGTPEAGAGSMTESAILPPT